MELPERLARMDGKLDRLTEHCERFEDHVEQLGRTLYGKNGSPGMTTRVALLEQSGERSKWLLRVIVTAVVGVIAAAVFA